MELFHYLPFVAVLFQKDLFPPLTHAGRILKQNTKRQKQEKVFCSMYRLCSSMNSPISSSVVGASILRPLSLLVKDYFILAWVDGACFAMIQTLGYSCLTFSLASILLY